MWDFADIILGFKTLADFLFVIVSLNTGKWLDFDPVSLLFSSVAAFYKDALDLVNFDLDFFLGESAFADELKMPYISLNVEILFYFLLLVISGSPTIMQCLDFFSQSLFYLFNLAACRSISFLLASMIQN